ncbi:hypothetical protein SAMN05216345_107158 [Cupriavidus sp. YR651]|uniref:hypothetical protein n=1 Tax=Cupriavidus sp. YR651 TaxID=1855315 RepID=UPI000886E1DD|nr:hypothetical protein [Cupriavidus sp. YR651]SDD25386.1 hypothetical protein SAMN05216345_107158 [Cupriavidus sp. YR651]
MQIFSFSDAQMRGAMPPHPSTPDLRVGFQLCVIPATAGLGHTCDYVFLRAGDLQPTFVTGRPEWWACLRGGVRILAGDRELALLGGGDVHTPAPAHPVEMQAVLDSILVRAVPRADGAAGVVDFVEIAPGEPDWAQQLQARGLMWAVCHRGALCLQWRPSRPGAEVHTAYLQPGMAFAPDSHDDFCIDALMPGAGLLCCTRMAVAQAETPTRLHVPGGEPPMAPVSDVSDASDASDASIVGADVSAPLMLTEAAA